MENKTTLTQKLFLAGSLFLGACTGNAEIRESELSYNPNKGITGNVPYTVRFINRDGEQKVKIRVRNSPVPDNTRIVNRPVAPVEEKKTEQVYDITQTYSF